MARSDAVWGIDIGQCALKALRCRAHEDEDKIVAEAFDYIEYPKILSQAGADPAELVGDALKQFLSRNTVRGDRVAISVSGQSGLARFIKLPPVEAKKIPDIVRYEARQQIPFDLNDVIWDYQRMGGGSEEEGFALETEIGLFAMKRDTVFRTLEPFQKAGIEIDFVQLTPLALYNFLLFDQLRDLPPADEYDPENPPKSVIILSLGTDASDLVVTNGFRVWQRSIPLGGNHFTKALTKELKLTFAKAEHLKRNAAAAQDPKAVFQAMRPVFNDLLTELQRSIGYFTSIDRAAEISHVVGLGNAMKLPGLRRYLAQSLGYEVRRLDELHGLVGSQVVSAPAFRENVLCFGTCYGLALQGLGKSGLRTNLLPKEIVQDRLVRGKKPWAVAAAAVLLLACAISYASFSHALGIVDATDPAWRSAESKANATATEASRYRNEANQATKDLEDTQKIGQHLVDNVENRILWLELLRALNQCLPHDAPPEPDQPPKPIWQRNKLHVTNIECYWLKNVADWHKRVQRWYRPPEEPEDVADVAAEAGEGADPDAAGAKSEPETPEGEGWIIMLTGHHYHNLRSSGEFLGAQFVRETLIRDLHNKKILLPTAERDKREPVSVRRLGISFPVLIDPQGVDDEVVTDPKAEKKRKSALAATPGTATEGGVVLKRFNFVVHFCWQPTTPRQRKELEETEQNEAAGRP